LLAMASMLASLTATALFDRRHALHFYI